jgi:hypothetical protein
MFSSLRKNIFRFLSILGLCFTSVILSVRPVSAAIVLEVFTAVGVGDEILIQWSTASETDNVGFYIQRSGSISGSFARVSPYFPSYSEDGLGAEYFWFDDTVETDVLYYYRLEAIDRNTISQYFGPIAGSTNPNLLTATPAGSRTVTSSAPTRTATATATISLTSPSGVTSPTGTGTPSEALISPSPTSAPEDGTLTPDQNLTPTVALSETATLEPLPTIELIFPATLTPKAEVIFPTPRATIGIRIDQDAGEEASGLSTRTVILIVLVAALWISLGALLFILVRQLRG